MMLQANAFDSYILYVVFVNRLHVGLDSLPWNFEVGKETKYSCCFFMHKKFLV